MANIDVIIPLYNGTKWIRETLDSALSQSFKPNKIIIVDDGSTDGSRELVYNHESIVLLRNPGRGEGGESARNFGIQHSEAEFVASYHIAGISHTANQAVWKNVGKIIISIMKEFIGERNPKDYPYNIVNLPLHGDWRKNYRAEVCSQDSI